VTLYLDTSSLVKLYVDETGSDEVRDRVAQAAVVATSIVAYAETRAAFARLRRSRDLTPAKFAAARRAHAVGLEAGELAERYALRGFDAIHLASFAEIARRAGPAETSFSSFDDQLNRASRDVARRLQSGG
jgi:predicted nucleic acid-binding protein